MNDQGLATDATKKLLTQLCYEAAMGRCGPQYGGRLVKCEICGKPFATTPKRHTICGRTCFEVAIDRGQKRMHTRKQT